MAGMTRTPKISENDMRKYEILDDVIALGYQDWIEDYMTSPVFPWFYMRDVTHLEDPTNGAFSHLIYGPPNKSSTADNTIGMIMPIVFSVLGNTELKELLRIRAGMFIKNQSGFDPKHHPHHIDRPGDNKPYMVLIYYVTDSDGTTGIYKDDKLIDEVEPKKGRVLFMDGDVYHASQCPKEHNQRIVINFNFRI